jgi:predicted O-methyltransferase YrrM
MTDQMTPTEWLAWRQKQLDEYRVHGAELLPKTIEDMLERTVAGHRKESFELMLAHLKTIDNPLIIETGCARCPDNWQGDGMSTVIFDRHINLFGGELHTVDIDPNNVELARAMVSDRSTIHCADSVAWLWEFNKFGRKIDLLYLDSFDFDFNDPAPSQQHHLYELTAIVGSLRNGTMIAVDDNFGDRGKGQLIKKFMEHIGNPMIHNGYQQIWKWHHE